jgi:hypothetical protein
MIEATLYLDDESIKVLGYEYRISQGTDHNGQVHSKPVAGKIALTLDVSRAQDTMLNEWAFSPTATKKGEILIRDSKGTQVSKKILFDHGYCIDYIDSMETIGTSQNVVRIIISSGKMSAANATEYKNNWAEVMQQ